MRRQYIDIENFRHPIFKGRYFSRPSCWGNRDHCRFAGVNRADILQRLGFILFLTMPHPF